MTRPSGITSFLNVSFGSFARKVAVLAPTQEIAKCGLGFIDDEKVVLLKETPGFLVLLQKSKLKPKELIDLLQSLQNIMNQEPVSQRL